MRKFFALISITFLSFGVYAIEKNTYESCPMLKGILEVHVNTGDTVKKGQLMYNIDPSPFIIAKDSCLNRVEHTRKQLDMHKKLLPSHAISQTDYETLLLKYKNAISDLKVAELKIKECYYYAPFNAKIISITHYTGSEIGDGKAVLTIQKI